MVGWERIGPPASGDELNCKEVVTFDPDTSGPRDGKDGHLGNLPNEVWINIIDCMFEDAAIKAYRGRPCSNEPRHYPLLRLRPGSDVLNTMALTSKYMRHLVLRKRFGTLYFHGGGVPCADEWQMFNLHMSVGKDKKEVQLAEPKIYVHRILLRESTNHKEYSDQLYKLIHTCPNLVTVEVSPITTQQFFADHRLPTPIPHTVTNLRVIGTQTKGQILGLMGKQQSLFNDIGRLDRCKMPIPYYKKDDLAHVQRIHTRPCFVQFINITMVPPNVNGEMVGLGDHDRYEFKRNPSGDFGNLKELKEFSLDLRHVRLFPRSLEELMQYARHQFGSSHTREPVLTEKMWKRNRLTNLWFWVMLGNTPKLPEMEDLVIHLELCPFARESVYDQWYWLRLWIERLQPRARQLWVRIHVPSPMIYFSDHRRSFTTFNDDRIADNFQPGWLLNALPQEKRMREFFRDLPRRTRNPRKLDYKYLNVELVADRFPGRYEQTVLLKSWSAAMDENTRTMVELQRGTSEINHQHTFLPYADAFNTMDWPKRLWERLHCVPRELEGTI